MTPTDVRLTVHPRALPGYIMDDPFLDRFFHFLLWSALSRFQSEQMFSFFSSGPASQLRMTDRMRPARPTARIVFRLCLLKVTNGSLLAAATYC